MRFNGGAITPLTDGQTGGYRALIGGSDGIAVNRQLARQLADRRQNIAVLERAALYQMADIIEDPLAVFPTIIIDL